MKDSIIDFLTHHGFIGKISAYYRFTIRADGKIAVDRRYRFRWQRLADVASQFLWSRKKRGGTAYFPELAQAKDAIITANALEEMYALREKIVQVWELNGVTGKMTKTLDRRPPAVRKAEEPHRPTIYGLDGSVLDSRTKDDNTPFPGSGTDIISE